MPKERKPINQNLTVPNALSVLRILIIPFFAWYFMQDQLLAAVALLVLSGLSDCVDAAMSLHRRIPGRRPRECRRQAGSL